ncbi:MAG: Hpt domain-containing protein [Rhizobiaceae bacterium]|jgi:HPt (histidine-containing phosphotransfer) domain-containing protein
MKEGTEAVAFAKPGGEACGAARTRPIDLAHLSRQTLGDRAVEEEVLSLFMQQAGTVCEQISTAASEERRNLAHGLKGSALGVGAFAVAEAASAVEAEPASKPLVKALSRRVEEAREFIAAISR